MECSFFPTLYAGPFRSLRDLDLEKIKNQPLTVPLFLNGIGVFIRGAFKNVVVGRTLWRLFTELAGFSKGETSLLSSWMLVITFAFAFYFILSGFFDMAKGIGKLFGLSLRSSFYYPYQGASISDFTYRFHSTWRKVIVNSVYLPLIEGSSSIVADIAALLISNMLFGLWFGFTFVFNIGKICLSQGPRETPYDTGKTVYNVRCFTFFSFDNRKQFWRDVYSLPKLIFAHWVDDPPLQR